MASVAEVKAAIDAALTHVQEGQQAIQAADHLLDGARLGLAAAVDGSGHEAVPAAQAAFAHAGGQLEEGRTATGAAVEQAQTYAAVL